MKFPGQRKRTHFFPSTRDPENSVMEESAAGTRVFDVVGIENPILALDEILNFSDMVLITDGK